MQTQTQKPNIHTPVVRLTCAELRPSAWRVYVNGEKPQVFDEMALAVTHASNNHGRIVPLAEVSQ